MKVDAIVSVPFIANTEVLTESGRTTPCRFPSEGTNEMILRTGLRMYFPLFPAVTIDSAALKSHINLYRVPPEMVW